MISRPFDAQSAAPFNLASLSQVPVIVLPGMIDYVSVNGISRVQKEKECKLRYVLFGVIISWYLKRCSFDVMAYYTFVLFYESLM